jgi:hypothetical protein
MMNAVSVAECWRRYWNAGAPHAVAQKLRWVTLMLKLDANAVAQMPLLPLMLELKLLQHWKLKLEMLLPSLARR